MAEADRATNDTNGEWRDRVRARGGARWCEAGVLSERAELQHTWQLLRQERAGGFRDTDQGGSGAFNVVVAGSDAPSFAAHGQSALRVVAGRQWRATKIARPAKCIQWAVHSTRDGGHLTGGEAGAARYRWRVQQPPSRIL